MTQNTLCQFLWLTGEVVVDAVVGKAVGTRGRGPCPIVALLLLTIFCTFAPTLHDVPRKACISWEKPLYVRSEAAGVSAVNLDITGLGPRDKESL